MALSDGHQCQPSRSKPRAMVTPSVSSGDRRRLAGGLRRIGRIARDPGHAHHAVVEIEEGLERRVVDGPVIRHAVEAPHAKVGGAQAWEMRAPVDRAPAHGVVHQRRDRRGRVVDRVILGEPAHVGLGAPVGVPTQLPVRLPVRIGLGIDPVALLEAGDADAGAGEHPGDGGARRAGADHEHVDPLAGGHGSGRERTGWSLMSVLSQGGTISHGRRRGRRGPSTIAACARRPRTPCERF